MAKLLESDFYYGAILSTLLNKEGMRLILIQGGKERQVYDCTTNDKEFRLFVKYRSASTKTKTEGYNSWQFSFTDKEMEEIKTYLNSEKDFQIGLVCGKKALNKSQYAVLKRDKIEELLKQGKTSISLSIKTGEHDFRISIGGGRENSLKIKANVIY